MLFNPYSQFKPSRIGAFTLIEVLVAFTILALALGALLPAFSSGLAAQSRAEVHASTVLQAQSKLAEVGSVIELAPGTTAGIFEDGTTWQVEIVPYSDAGLKEALPDRLAAYRVMVTVAQDDHPVTMLTTLRLGAAQ